jgi:N-acetylglucosamine kinase-like BadF-type ATPase
MTCTVLTAVGASALVQSGQSHMVTEDEEEEERVGGRSLNRGDRKGGASLAISLSLRQKEESQGIARLADSTLAQFLGKDLIEADAGRRNVLSLRESIWLVGR